MNHTALIKKEGGKEVKNFKAKDAEIFINDEKIDEIRGRYLLQTDGFKMMESIQKEVRRSVHETLGEYPVINNDFNRMIMKENIQRTLFEIFKERLPSPVDLTDVTTVMGKVYTGEMLSCEEKIILGEKGPEFIKLMYGVEVDEIIYGHDGMLDVKLTEQLETIEFKIVL